MNMTKDEQHYSIDIAEACEALDRLKGKLAGDDTTVRLELSNVEQAMDRLTSHLLDKVTNG